MPVGECFDCGLNDQLLTFDHWNGYAADSVRVGHGDQRAREAIEHPERFHLVCWPCHRRRTISQIARNNLMIDASIGSETRVALNPNFQKWRTERLEESSMRTEAKEIQEKDALAKYNAELPEGKRLTMGEYKALMRTYWRNVYRVLQGKSVDFLNRELSWKVEIEAARIERERGYSTARGEGDEE